MTPEQQLYRILRNTFLRDSHNQRIENMTGSGVPDISACLDGYDVWIETKIRNPYLLLRPFQWAWLRSRSEKGGICLVLAARVELDEVEIHVPLEMRVEDAPSGRLRVLSEPRCVLPIHRNSCFDFWQLIKNLRNLQQKPIVI